MKWLNMKNEEWRDVVGYEGLYQVSNFGNVRSLDRYVPNTWKNGLRLVKGKVLKLHYTTDGYKQAVLSIDRKTKHCAVHRLVAMAFIPNPNNLKEVNHIDEVKDNNRADNLEWVTRKYNMNYGTLNKRLKNLPDRSKPVLQFTLDGEFVKEYPSQKEASRQTGIRHEHISACCRGLQKTAKGYKWKYKSINN